MATPAVSVVAEIMAALSYGERLAQERAQQSVALAPDQARRGQQQHVADRERKNVDLIEARLKELGPEELEDLFRPFFDSFFDRTVPTDWVEAQTFHYVGDALVADFAEYLIPALDPVSGEVIRRALGERDEQDAFALEEITRALGEDPGVAERVAAYSRRIAGEALTQTRAALNATEVIATLLDGDEGEKRMVLDLLERHRRRLDRLGIERVDDPNE
ncbi:MAG: ferritin-like fold-containing protein [Actinomycetota bacterium]